MSLRKLAAFRIGLGLVLLFDLVDRASAFGVHFAGGGVYPTHSVYPRLSLLHFSDSAFYQGAFFAVAIASALALTIGYRTRLATISAWFALVNIQHYAHLSHFSADDVVRLSLFWGIWLPLGARWSLDSRRTEMEDVNSWATTAILAQVAVITLASGFHKLFDPTWGAGRGVELALRAHGTALGLALAESTSFAVVLNYFTMLMQIVGALLLFISPRSRIIGGVTLLGFQAALSLCLNLSFFPFVTMVGLLLFLPESLFVERAPNWRPSWSRLVVAGAVGALIPALSLTGNETVTNFVRFAGFEQNWSMFAPPPTHLPWIVAKLGAAQGVEIDAATREAFTGWEAARDVHVPAGIRWATLAFRVGEMPEIASRIGHSLCGAWRTHAPEAAVRTSDVYLVVKDLSFTHQPVEPHLLAQVPCE